MRRWNGKGEGRGVTGGEQSRVVKSAEVPGDKTDEFQAIYVDFNITMTRRGMSKIYGRVFGRQINLDVKLYLIIAGLLQETLQALQYISRHLSALQNNEPTFCNVDHAVVVEIQLTK